MDPQHSEDDDTKKSKSEEVMQDKQSGNLFTESVISHFVSVEYEKQENLPVDVNAGVSEARKNWNSKSASPVKLPHDSVTWPEMIKQSFKDCLV